MQLKRVAEAKLPTPLGDFLMVGFEELATGHDHAALVFGDISGKTPVLARVHSECLTGDALFSLRCRDFTLCADMFKLLGVDEVRLLTNNPKKVEILTEAGINIVERVPLIVGRNPNNEHYLDTKAAKMGHLLSK